jgi:hypothetical protein
VVIITNPNIDFFGGFCVHDIFKLSYLFIANYTVYIYIYIYIYIIFLKVTNKPTVICSNICNIDISFTKYVINWKYKFIGKFIICNLSVNNFLFILLFCSLMTGTVG